MRIRPLPGAVLVGSGALLLSILAFRAAALAVYLALSPIWFSAALFLHSAAASSAAWLPFAVKAAALLAAGYLAASLVPARKLTAGLLTGLVTGILLAAGQFMSAGGRSGALARAAVILPAAVVLSSLGACAERAWLPRRRPWHARRKLRALWVHASLPLGLLLLIVSVLVVALYPGTGQAGAGAALSAEATGLLSGAGPWRMIAGLLVGMVGALLGADALRLFARDKGWKRGVALNWYVWLAGACAVAFAVGFVRRFRENRPDLDSPDPPLSYAALTSAEDGNGAALYLEAASLLSDPDGLDRHAGPAPDRIVPWRREENPALAHWLARQEQALELALRASRTPLVRFPARWPPDGRAPARTRCLTLSRALAARAALLAGEGDVAEALPYLDAAFRLGACLLDTSLRHFETGLECRSAAVLAAREILRREDLARDELAALGRSLSRWSAVDALTRQDLGAVVRSEPRREVERWFIQLRGESVVSFAASQFTSKRAVLAVQSSVLDEILAAGSWPEMIRRYEREDARALEFLGKRRSPPSMGWAERAVHAMAHEALPDLGRLLRGLLSQRARVRMLRALVAARLFWLERGALPASWEDLAPAYVDLPPLDPYSDGLLRLTVLDGTLVIYSVGENGRDDGGMGRFSRQDARERRPEGAERPGSYGPWKDLVLEFSPGVR